MKVVLSFALLALVSMSAGEVITTVYNSVEEFRAKNPGAKLIAMDVDVHELDASRSYSLGKRQTGLNLVVNLNRAQLLNVQYQF